MEHLFEPFHYLIRTALGMEKEGLHLALPALVDIGGGHQAERFLKVARFKVANQKAIRPQKEGIVTPAGLGQRLEHFGPHLFVTALVFDQHFRPDPEKKTDSFHENSIVDSEQLMTRSLINPSSGARPTS